MASSTLSSHRTARRKRTTQLSDDIEVLDEIPSVNDTYLTSISKNSSSHHHSQSKRLTKLSEDDTEEFDLESIPTVTDARSTIISNPSKSRHRAKKKRLTKLSEDDIEEFDLSSIPAVAATRCSTPIPPARVVQTEDEDIDESPILQIIKRKKRKSWAIVVAPVDEEMKKKTKESIIKKLSKFVSKIPTPLNSLLDFIETRNGFTIRSYFQFIVWLFYINIFIFILYFMCIVIPTFIYSNSVDFYSYTINQYYERNNSLSYNNTNERCQSVDPQCQILDLLLNKTLDYSATCLNNPFTSSACCSILTDEFFRSPIEDNKNGWTNAFSFLIDGTGTFAINRLFIGYYRNLTRTNENNSYIQTYNMGLAFFLTTIFALLITGIIIVRQYSNGMKKSYVQNNSFENDLFQYVFARWDHRIDDKKNSQRHGSRFTVTIKNILFEHQSKKQFKIDQTQQNVLFKIKRFLLWIVTIIVFIGAIVIVYFTNRFSFQEKSRYLGYNRVTDMALDYLPSAVVSIINLGSQLIFSFMKDFELYTHTTRIRHYLFRVIIIRLLLLFSFVFIIILQISCNGHPCGSQSESILCEELGNEHPRIHCWETLIGQMMYRLVITDTVVMIVVHIIVDPLRTLLIFCCCKRKTVENENEGRLPTSEPVKKSFFTEPLQFEIGDYVIDLTYTQTLCWHGLFFCPFLSLIAAMKNILIFGIKMLTLKFFRKRSAIELSPARTRHIFAGVLLLSFVWALLPIAFLTTSLRPSRGCGPFRIYSHETDFYMYYSMRNLISQINNKIVVEFLFKLTSAVVIIPIVLILILYSSILIIRRNSYRAASIELYKLLYSSHQTHKLALNYGDYIQTTL